MPSGSSRLKAPILPCSRQDLEAHHHREHHLPGRGSYLKTVVFGGLDGVLTIFAVVSGSVGASVDTKRIVCLSLATILASAFSMGYGEYVSSKAEADFVSAEKAREEFEIDHCPEIEQKEMFDIYTSRYNFSGPDAHALVQLTFKHRVGRAHAQEFFLRHMMIEELGIMLEEDRTTPIKNSLLMGGSFAVMGMFPLLGYVVLLVLGNDNAVLGFLVTVSFSLLGSASLGYFKVRAAHAQGTYLKQSKLRSALCMTLNGVAVGLSSYVLGLVLSKV